MEGYYPDPTNCSNFYRCVDFDESNPGDKLSVYFFRCPTGAIYDPKRNTCDKPENIQPPRNCSAIENTTSPPEVTTESPPETTEAPTETTTAPPDSETTVAPEEQTTPPPDSETTTMSVEETTPNMTEEPTTQQPDVTTQPQEGTTEDTPVTTEIVPTTENTDMPETTTVVEQGTTEMQQETTAVPPTEEIPTTVGTPKDPPPPANQTACDCCNTEPGQYSYVCPTTFRRDPRYCNRFYQCTKRDESDVNVVFFNCPNGTIFDNKMQQCLYPGKNKTITYIDSK
jgi:hypothetical protein